VILPVSRTSRFLPATLTVAFLVASLVLVPSPNARAQVPSASPQTPPTPQTESTQNSGKDEIVSHDSPATFQVRVNLVLARVVVRDADGKVVTNLKKEDFKLTDERKPQIISSFSVETPASHAPAVDSAEAASSEPSGKAVELPQRFVALLFDDLHLSVQDSMFARQAAEKVFGSVGARDRLSVFTTSGQVQQDFTDDRKKLDEAVQRISPHSLAQNSAGDCPPMNLQEAHMIADETNADAMQVAVQDYINCSGASGPGAALTAQNIVSAAAESVLNLAETEEQTTYQSMLALIRRMSVLPGQRVIVMMSPGFFVLPAMLEPGGQVVDRATKENVVINAIDVRGLYVSSVYDASVAATTASVTPLKTQYIMKEEQSHFTSLAELADGTGGIFFHDRNNIDQGLLQAVGEPEVSYVLGFTPHNLKLDGRYHSLKVSLTNNQKWALQARRGYFAPRGNANPETAAKEEIQQAVFSQEELHDLPVECQTQFFKSGDGARLSVVTHVGTELIKFRKVDGRNQDTLTITTGIFDQNGRMLAGLQRTLELELKDATLERASKTGLNVKLNFDVQPGTFLVRTVVRDSEGAQMGATTRGVVIP
jgi:VWFA-related protein